MIVRLTPTHVMTSYSPNHIIIILVPIRVDVFSRDFDFCIVSDPKELFSLPFFQDDNYPRLTRSRSST